MGIITDFAKIVLAGTLIVNVVTLPVYAKGESAPVQEQISVQPVVLSEEETDIINTVTEDTTTDEEVIVEEQPITEDVSASDVSESEEESGTEGGIMLLNTEGSIGQSTQTIIGYLANTEPLQVDTVIEINSGIDLILLSNVDPKVYQNCVIHVVNSGQGLDTTGSYNYNGTTYTFTGLGNENYPFSGKFKFDELSKATAITLGHSLFNVLSTDTTIVNSNDESISIKLVNGSNTNTALLADKVVKVTNASGTWNVTVSSSTIEGIVANPPVIGTIDSNCIISLSVADESVLVDEGKTESKLPVSGTGDIGLVCGTLNGQLTLTSLTISAPGVDVDANKLIKVNSSGGNVGGLVGSMGPGASLTTGESVTLTFGEISTNNRNAGGLVGKADSGATINVSSDILNVTSVTATSGSAGGIAGEATDLKISKIPGIIVPTITGDNAGGLFGSYTYSGVEGTLSTISKNISGITLNGKNNAGGLFGVLFNNSNGVFTINPSNPSADTAAVDVTFDSGSVGNVGGLIGRYQANNYEDASLLLNTGKVKSNLKIKASTYGGLVGYVGDNDNGMANYIEICDAETITTATESATDFGGLIAKLTNSGHMIKTTGNIKVVNSLPGSSTCGGMVGYMPSGIFWLVTQPDLTEVSSTDNILTNRGWIVGNRGNTLVVTESSDWNYNKGSKTNDIGNWGQVLSLYKFEGLLTMSGHNVNVVQATKTGNQYSIGTLTQFAAVALRVQLDHKGGLIITDDIADNGSVDLVMTNDINLSGTGLTGFQRDDNPSSLSIVNITGKKNDGKYSITLPVVNIYARDNSHKRQGLFACVNELNVKDLTITGGINITTYGNHTFYAGGIAAEVVKTINLENVETTVALTTENGGNNSAAGGLIGNKKFTDTGVDSIIFKECFWKSNIKVTGNDSSIYVGGLIGRVDNNEKQDKTAKIIFDNCTISGSLSRTGNFDDARIGGVIGSCYARKPDRGFTLDINGLNVSNTTIDSNSKNQIGGFLSYELINVQATIKKVSVQNSTLHASSNFGGLVYKGTGYWSIMATQNENATTVPGVSISDSTFTGKSDQSAPSAMLVCHGEETDFKNALYLEILDGAFELLPGITLNINGSEYFDELVGTTIGSNDKGNGIVSIATTGDRIDTTSNCNTYQHQLTEDYKNRKTRYYYNLDSFGAVGDKIDGRTLPSGEINSPANMVMYSAYTHCHSELKKYFYNGPENITGVTLDLTGYSYYPAESFTTVDNAAITFDYQGIETKEVGNKKPSDSTKQHYGMHTGLFTDVVVSQSSNDPEDMKVSNLTLSGTVGGSAIIHGNAQGGNTNAKLTLDIDGVQLKGIRIYPTLNSTDQVSPLLFNSIGSYTTLKMNNIETLVDSYSDVVENSYIASSLIGNVGSATGNHIQLTFSDMVLKNAIFSRALFLESFQYAGDSSGIYNFTNLDNKRYTLGQELSNTDREGSETGPSGRNNGLQYNFFDTTITVCSVFGGETADPETYFSMYKRYVYQVESGTFHELDINLARSGLTEGCGTPNDPYIIRTAKQLEDLAMALYTNVDGMKIQVDTNVLNGSTLNSFSCGHQKDIKETHKTYTGTNSGWFEDSTDITTNVKLYLRNAYYSVLADEIQIPAGWTGLGASEESAFCGVIEGNGNTMKITSVSGSQFGGLIKFSLGSVVKNLTIDYTDQSLTVTCQGTPSNESNATFFGGVVGWCIGGDTIIDSVAVKGLTTPDVSGTNPHLASVGGYVGVVGGAIMSTTDSKLKYGGGVVFRRTVEGGLKTGNALETSNYFYVNPYVGRVLDGYVISEDTRLDNTDKNYQIPNFKPSDSLLVFDSENKKLLVNNAEGLWLLSAIANSGAGAIQNVNCKAYTYGKARIGTYENLDGTPTENDLKDENYLGGVENRKKNETYLTSWDTSNAFYNICTNTITIEFSKARNIFDMSGFGNGFRGIGTSYGTNTDQNSNYRLLKITEVKGNKNTIKLKQDRKEYTEEKDNWTSIGSGLFVLLQPGSTFTASNLSLTGTTGISYYTGTNNTQDNLLNTSNNPIGSLESGERLSYAGAGLFAGNIANVTTISSMLLNDINLIGNSTERITVNNDGLGSTHAGGLIGLLWSTGTINNVELMDCDMSYVNIRGRMNTGGYIGYSKCSSLNIKYTGNCVFKDTVVLSTQKSVRDNNTMGASGVGGLIGYNISQLTINSTIPDGQTKIPQLIIENLMVTNGLNKKTADKTNAGGLIGLWVQPSGTAKINNIIMRGNIEIIGGGANNPNTSTGGLVGAIVPSIWGNDWTDGKNVGMEIRGIRIVTEQDSEGNNSKMVIKNGRQVGGLFGMTMFKNKVTIDDVIIGGESHPVSITNTVVQSGQAVSAIIAVALDAQNTTISNTKITNTNLVVNGDGDRGAGLVTGFVQKNESNIKLKNISLVECSVVTNNENLRTGLIFGKLEGKHNIFGSGILIKDCISGLVLDSNAKIYTPQNLSEFIPTKDNTGVKVGDYKLFKNITGEQTQVSQYINNRKGIFGGDSGTSTVQLVGVSLQQSNNTLPMKEYGVNPSSNSYIVRADYTGVANGIASKVTTSPSSPVSSLIDRMDVTGDGASLTGTQAIGIKIREDLKVDNNLNLKHSNVSEANEYLTSKENIWSYSDFKTAGGNDFTLPNDTNFPVLVLTSTSSKEINKIVYSWISVLTNRKLYSVVDNKFSEILPSSDFTLNVKSYKWNNEAFEEYNEDNTFIIDSDNKTLKLNEGHYDNQQSRFTLLDAAFTDPTGGGNTYHLYIPVIVQKVLNFRFYAAAQTGTTYDSATYESLDELAIASNGEKITVLLGYEYDRTTSEWQTAVDNGDNLLGNFNKNIKLDAELPSDTKLTLVDRNRNNKAYTATYSSKDNKTIDFSKFVDTNNASWSPVKLCDMLTLTAEPNEDGQYVKLKNETGATIRTTDGYYYKFVDESSRENQELYKITVRDVINPLSETYYLTIQTPSSDTGFYNNLITCPDRLGDDLFSQPTQRKKNGRWDYSRKGNENRIVFGNCFSQTVEISTGTSGNEINSSNRSISATLTSKIKFANETAKNLYVAYAKDQSLYQCFELKMRDERNRQKNLAGGIAITAVYSLNDEPSGLYNYVIDEQTGLFRLTYPSGIGSNTVKDLGVDQELILKASITLDFTDTAIIDQFPVKDNDESNVGIQLWATSKLAFKENNLPYSTISTDANDDKYFYRKEFKTANLNYNTTGDVNSLGINGKDDDSFTVNSRAIYNVSSVEQAADAKKLRYKLTLWQKRNTESGDVAYTNVTDWGSYLEGGFDTGLSTVAHYVSKDSSTHQATGKGNESGGDYTVDIDLENGLNKDVPIQIPVDLKVLTGSAFEAEGKQFTYANYKIQMEAFLLDGKGEVINGTIASDYIIYTNAKVNYNYLKQPSGTKQSE